MLSRERPVSPPGGIGDWWFPVGFYGLRRPPPNGSAGMEESLCELTLGSDEFVDDLALRRQ